MLGNLQREPWVRFGGVLSFVVLELLAVGALMSAS